VLALASPCGPASTATPLVRPRRHIRPSGGQRTVIGAPWGAALALGRKNSFHPTGHPSSLEAG